MAASQIKHAVDRQTMPSVYAERARIQAAGHARSVFHQWMINYTVSGRCIWSSVKAEYTSSAGMVMMTRPDTPMAWRVPRDVRARIGRLDAGREQATWDTIYCVYHPRPHWHPWLDAIDFEHGMASIALTGAAAEAVRDAMMNLERVYAAGGAMRGERALHALEAVLIAIHQELMRDEIAADARIRHAMDFIQSVFADPITVETIAAESGLSASHFSALFTKATGTSPGEYVEQIRLSRAAEMLGFSAEPICDVAARTGFTEPNYFARRFRLRYGLSPSQFRRETQSGGRRDSD